MNEFQGRISCEKHDLGYQNWIDLGGPSPAIKIMLDGVEQRHCTMADPIQGVICCCKLNSQGEIYAVGDKIAMETVSGHVQVLVELKNKKRRLFND